MKIEVTNALASFPLNRDELAVGEVFFPDEAACFRPVDAKVVID